MKSLFADKLPKALKPEELRGWIEADLKKREELEQAVPSDPFTAPEIPQQDDSWMGGLASGVGATVSNWMTQVPAQIRADFYTEVSEAKDKGFIDNLKDDEFPDTVPGPTDVFGGLVTSAAGLFVSKEEADAAAQEANLEAIEASQETARQYPVQPSAGRFYEKLDGSLTGAIPSFFRAVVEEPKGASQMAMRLVGQMVPGLAGAAVVGYTTKNPQLASAFLGLQSGVMERYLEPVDFLISKGMDPADPVSVKNMISDPEVLEEARRAGITRGAIIGSLDFLSGKLASVSLAKNAGVNAAIQMPLQGGLGAGAEAGAQALTRDEIDWRDVTLEFFGEFVGAPLEVAAMANEYVRAKGVPKDQLNMEDARLDSARGDPNAVAVLKASGMSDDQITKFVAKAKPKVIEETLAGIKQYGEDLDTRTVEERQTAIEEGQKKLAESLGEVPPTAEIKLAEPKKKEAPKRAKKPQTAPVPPATEPPATGAPTASQTPSETDPAPREPITVKKQTKGGDEFEGRHTKLELSNGQTATIQRMQDGLRGWHWMDRPDYGGPKGPDWTYIAENKNEAIQYILDHYGKEAGPARSSLNLQQARPDATVEQLAQLQTELFGNPVSIREMTPEQRSIYELERDRRYPPVPLEEALEAGQSTIKSQPFIDWFKKSAAVTADGIAQVYYHGTGRDIRVFGGAKSASLSGETGPFFLSPSPEFASEFADIDQSAGGGGKKRVSGQNVLPVFVSAQNPFDADTLEHVQGVETEVKRGLAAGDYAPRDVFDRKGWVEAGQKVAAGASLNQLVNERLAKLEKELPTGAWWALELPAVQKSMRKLGHDGFFVKEAGERNLAVFSPTQIKSVFNRGTFDPEDPNIDAMAAKKDRFVEGGDPVPDGVDTASSLEEMFKLLKKQTFDTGRNLKLFMQELVTSAAQGVDLTVQNYENQQHLARMAIKDALYALKSNANAVGWYDKTVRKALNVLGLIHPEIKTDQNAKFAFTFALAVTSNGLKVDKNFELAEVAYETFKKTGKMPTDIGIGTAAEAINSSLANFNSLIENFGWEDARALMMTNFTVAQLRKMGLQITGEDASTVVRGAAYIGPKIGNGFFSNLNGMFDALTIDRWLMRTWGRWTGNLVNVREDMVDAKGEDLKALISKMNESDIEAFREATGVNVTGDDFRRIATELKAASTDPEIREKMSSIGAKQNTDGKPIGDHIRRAANSLWGYLDGQIEQPETSQRQYIRDTFGSALKWLNANGYPELTMSDLQALLWYPEKRLYDAAKNADEESIKEGYVDDEAPDYAIAAKKLALAKGIKADKIDEAFNEAEQQHHAAKVGTGGTGRDPAGSVEEAGVKGGTPRRDGGERQERARLLKRWLFQEDRHRRTGDGGVRVFRGTSLGRNKALGRVKARFEPTGNFRKIIQASELRVPEAFYELAPTPPEELAELEVKVAKAQEAVSKAKSDSARQKAEDRLEKAQAQLDAERMPHAILFSEGITASKKSSKYGAAVYVYPTEDYANMRLFLTEDRMNGFAIKPDGDIVSVFSSGGGTVHAMLELAVEQGGTKLDAFNTVLPKLYGFSDFVEVGRDPWNEEYKPDDWDYEVFKDFNNGRPDIVYMEYRPVALKGAEPTIDEDGDAEAILPRKSGAQLAASKTRAGGVASNNANTSYDATLTQIHNNFIALLNLTVRTGGVTAAGGAALGQHTKSNGVIRLKEARDFEVLVHEAWHALHEDKGPELSAAINSTVNSAELASIARNIYGGTLTNASRNKILREGFAEFGRLYMTNKGEALNWAPNFYQAFENVLQGADPKLLEGLRTVRSQYERLFDLSSVAFGRSFLTKAADEGLYESMKKGIEREGVLGYLKTELGVKAHHAYTGVIDKAKVFTRLRVELQNIEEKNKSGLIHDLLRSEDPRVLYEMAQRSGQVATDEIFNGITDFWGNRNTTASVRDALARIFDVDPAKKIDMDEAVIEDFNNYLVAKTVFEDETNPVLKARKDKPTAPYNEADARQIILELEQKYGTRFTEAAEMIYDYNRGLWKKMRDAGMLSDQQYQDGLVRRNYVPLLRDMTGTAVGRNAKKNALTSGETKVIKQRGGSARDIIFPLESIMTATMAMEQSLANNRVKVALAQMADRAGYGSGAFVERIPDTQLKAIEFPILDAMNAALDGSGLASQDQDMVRMIMESVYDESAKSVVFRRQIKTPGPDGEHIMFFWENGERKAIAIGNDTDLRLAEDLFAAMDGLGQENFGALVDLLTLSSAVTRAGVTSWFDFLGVNYIRDQFSAAMLTDVGYIPFFSGIKGMYHILKQTDVARDYMIGGGAMGGVNSAALEAIQTKRDISIMKRKGYSVQILGADKIGSFTGLVKSLSHLSELMEGATRVGLYEKAYKRARAEGLSHKDAMIEASYIGTDYINFGRHGSAKSMRFAARIIPFFNAQIQGLDKTLRAMFGDEVASRKGMRFALKAYLKSNATIDGMQGLTRVEKQQLKNGKRLWIKMGTLAMFSAALGLMFKGDPDYEEATPYIKSRYWVIPLGNGKVFLLPKPFELALLGNAVEAVIESDGKSLSKFLDGLQQTLTPPVQNPLIKYVYEVATNYDTFRKRPLVPTWMQSWPASQQAHGHTATVAKKIGEAIGVSPIYVEHFVTSIGASAGRDLLSMLDFTDPNRPQKGWDETAILRRFIRETRKGGNTVTEFYAQMSDMNGSITTAGVGYKKLMDQGRELQANRLYDTLNDEQKAWAVLNYNWDPAYKRMHPGYRTNQITQVLTGLKKEMFLPRIENAKGEEIVLTPGQKLEASEVINDIIHREMRNYLVAMKAPGWQDKEIMPVEYSYDLLREVNPDVADILEERIAKQRIYDFDVVMQNWPEVKDALIGDGEYADLDSYLRDFGVRPSRRKKQ